MPFEVVFVTGSQTACNTRQDMLSQLVGHLVDAHRERQDEDIVLPGLDLHPIGIAHPEPFLGNLGNLISALADSVLMVENIALHFQVGATSDPDRPALATAATPKPRDRAAG